MADVPVRQSDSSENMLGKIPTQGDQMRKMRACVRANIKIHATTKESLLNLKHVDFLEKAQAELAIGILSKPVKTLAEQQFLKQGLQGLNLFKSNQEVFSDDHINHQLFREISLQVFPKDHVLFHAGDQGEIYFIVLIGSVACLIPKPKNEEDDDFMNDKKHDTLEIPTIAVVKATRDVDQQSDLKSRFPNLMKVKTYLPGEAFGEISLITKSARTATMVCSEETYFMTLTKVGFEKIMGKHHEAVVKERLRFLQSFSFFSEIPESKLLSFLHFFTIDNCPKSKVLFKHGDEVDQLYFIKSGEVEVFKYVNFDDASSSQDGCEEVKNNSEVNEPLYVKMNIRGQVKKLKSQQKLISVAIATAQSVVGDEEIHLNLAMRDSLVKVRTSSAEIFVIQKKQFLCILKEKNTVDLFHMSCAAKCAFAKQRESNAQIARNIEQRSKNVPSFRRESVTRREKIQHDKLLQILSVSSMNVSDIDECDEEFNENFKEIRRKSSRHSEYTPTTSKPQATIGDLLEIPYFSEERMRSSSINSNSSNSVIRGNAESLKIPSSPTNKSTVAFTNISINQQLKVSHERITLTLPSRSSQRASTTLSPRPSDSTASQTAELKAQGILLAYAETLKIRSNFNTELLQSQGEKEAKIAKETNVFNQMDEEIKRIALCKMNGQTFKKNCVNIFSGELKGNSPSTSSKSCKNQMKRSQVPSTLTSEYESSSLRLSSSQSCEKSPLMSFRSSCIATECDSLNQSLSPQIIQMTTLPSLSDHRNNSTNMMCLPLLLVKKPTEEVSTEDNLNSQRISDISTFTPKSVSSRSSSSLLNLRFSDQLKMTQSVKVSPSIVAKSSPITQTMSLQQSSSLTSLRGSPKIVPSSNDVSPPLTNNILPSVYSLSETASPMSRSAVFHSPGQQQFKIINSLNGTLPKRPLLSTFSKLGATANGLKNTRAVRNQLLAFDGFATVKSNAK